MKLILTLVAAAIFATMIGVIAWIFDDSFTNVAIPFLIGGLASLLVEVTTKEDD